MENFHVLKSKIQENFKTIHYVYSLLYPKIYNRVNSFGIVNKTNFDFVFSNWKAQKQNGAISPKIVNKLPTPIKQKLIIETLSLSKNSEEYKKRDNINEFE